ncbi:MAG TPA: pyridoxamine 5'-phosphate oxidase [Thermodesulfobacteriota bacterium]|nr:pyridoxamine 5'-phosphate oxidase [Thermodesulfobacteriota bacterium]
MSVKDFNKQYIYSELLESQIDPDPIKQFEMWFKESADKGIKYPNAFALSTSTLDGKPNSRFVLLKGFDKSGFVFYTNTESVKGEEINDNPNASMVFWWDMVERQVRINGTINLVSDEEADEYFKSRPRGSQLGAWASKQSTVIENRDSIDQSYAQVEKKYEGKDIPRPPYWHGYRLRPDSIEFWQGRPDRLHDRLRYRLQKEDKWIIERLCP